MVILPIEWIFGYIAMDKWGIFNSYVTNYTRVVFNAIYLPISLVYLTLPNKKCHGTGGLGVNHP